MMRFHSAAIACLVAFTMSVPASAQDDDRRVVRLQTTDGIIRAYTFTLRGGPVVANAPFSADATTTVTQTLGDGTKIEQKTTAKLYRDSTGRVRLEQTVIGLDRLNASAQPQTTITFDSVPGDPIAVHARPGHAHRPTRGTRGPVDDAGCVELDVHGQLFHRPFGESARDLHGFRQRVDRALLQHRSGCPSSACCGSLRSETHRRAARRASNRGSQGHRETHHHRDPGRASRK